MSSAAIDFSDLGGKQVQPAPSTGTPGKGIDFSDLGGRVVQPAQSSGQTQQPGIWDRIKSIFSAPVAPGGSSVAPLGPNAKPMGDAGPGGSVLAPLAGSPMANAVSDVRAGNYARAAHGLINSAGRALMPLAAPAVMTAPIASLATLGVGAGAQFLGQKGAAALGATPDQANLAGDVAGLAAGGGTAWTTNKVGSVFAPLGETPTTPRGTIPPEDFTPIELKAYADENGIPLTAAQATQHNLPLNLQSAGERSTVGGTAVRNMTRASQAAVVSHAENLMEGFSPSTPDLASAGDAIQKGVQSALEQEQLQSAQEYSDIDQKAGNVRVDLTPVKQQANQILQGSQFIRQAGVDPKTATRILQGMADIPDTGTFSQAAQLRSALLDAARQPDLAISNTAQGWLKQAIGATDGQMMTAAKSSPGLEGAFRDANDHWTQLQEDFNNPRSPLAQILAEPDPSKVPQKLTPRGQIGGSPYNAQLLDTYGIDKGPVKWAIMNDLATKDFRLWNKNLGGYSDDFLKSVFTPDELDDVYKTGAIARSVNLNTNPSGTAGVTGAMQDVQKPIRSLLPKGIAAGVTKWPWFNNRLMRPGGGTDIPSGVIPLSVVLGTHDDQQ